MKCDVVIPAYNNAAQLAETLDSLFTQTLPNHWSCHAIISDDGSTDDTLASLDLLTSLDSLPPPPWRLTVLPGPHTGPGGARRRALPHLSGDVALLLGADILLRPGVLAQHLGFHEHHSAPTEAALGMVRWDPRLLPTPLMEWMTHGGQQNDFDYLLGVGSADPAHFFYGSHLSLKTSLLRRGHISDMFQGYGWEDLSLGRELQKHGVRLHVLHHAIALHRHFYSVAAIATRQQAVGGSLREYQKLYPDVIHPLQRSRGRHALHALWIALGGQGLLSAWLKVFEEKRSFPRLFLVFTSLEFWKGVWRSYGGFMAFLKQKDMFYSKTS